MEARLMAYGGLSQQTQEFLWNVRFNNEKTWFDAHKAEYLEFVYEPLRALAQEVSRGMEKKYGLDAHLHVSRIYRDMRIKNGRGPYKDHLWFSLRKVDDNWTEAPIFYFEMYPEHVSYGLGCFLNSSLGMERLRAAIDANPAQAERIILDLDGQDWFTIIGDEYKKKKAERGEILNRWYNRKWLGFEHRMNWGREAMAKNLPKTMVERFGVLLPAYEYFSKLADMA